MKVGFFLGDRMYIFFSLRVVRSTVSKNMLNNDPTACADRDNFLLLNLGV